jgi:hypothetical protein
MREKNFAKVLKRVTSGNDFFVERAQKACKYTLKHNRLTTQ